MTEHSTIKSRFIQHLRLQYPEMATKSQLEEMISENLLSEKIIELPLDKKYEIENEISKYEQLKTWTAEKFNDQYEHLGVKKSKNLSVCTSFDFHITSENKLKLIEINTNASFLALGLEFYKCLDLKSAFSSEDLIQMFQNETKLASQKELKSLAIIDDNPEQQRLYLEFLIYQSMFLKRKISCSILKYTDLPFYINSNSVDLVYNRYTDFYLANSESSELRNLFNLGKIELSPNPYEYFLVADKQRMLNWQQQTDVEIPESLLKIYDLGIADKNEIWSFRKNLFFKPKNSFGSKQAYKGANISRKTFDEFYGPTMIAQEYAQPAEVSVLDQMMKYDLRCYAYQGKLQLVMARIYQGQTTNLRTTGGGFAAVNFI